MTLCSNLMRRHCQVVEAETRLRRVGTPLRSYLTSKQPVLSPLRWPNSRNGSASLHDTPTPTTGGIAVGNGGRWVHTPTKVVLVARGVSRRGHTWVPILGFMGSVRGDIAGEMMSRLRKDDQQVDHTSIDNAGAHATIRAPQARGGPLLVHRAPRCQRAPRVKETDRDPGDQPPEYAALRASDPHL
jgi:hypothetical protein